MNHFFTKIIKRAGFLRLLNFSIVKNINGKKVVIPVINGYGEDNLSLSEMWMCSLIQKILNIKRGVFIDIGVNVGQTLIKLRTVDATTEYIGFEPNPQCVYYTTELIRANKYVNTRLIPAGLFTEDCILQLNLYSDGDTDSAASLIDDFRPGAKVFKKMYVPVMRFETVSRLLDIKNIAVVKIDVEGAELEVLQSLKSMLETSRPFIFMEILPCYDDLHASRIQRQNKIEELLTDIHYCIFRVIKNDKPVVTKMVQLTNIGVHADPELCEYIMAPAEYQAQVALLF